MLKLTILGEEHFDDEKQEFVTRGDVTLALEHSLVSLSKWEQIWEKPFLGSEEKSAEETFSYVQCMVVTEDFPPEVFSRLSNDNIKQINDYIDSKMTATWFADTKETTKSRETITSELIYYWMVALNMPMTWESRHLNNLFTMIRVLNEKNQPEKKLSRGEIAARNRKLNEERKARFGTQG